MADDTRMTQMQRDLYAMQKQVGDLAEIKKQMETLTATMNALLQEKSMRSENEDRRQYHEYHEGESSGGGRPYQNLFNKILQIGSTKLLSILILIKPKVWTEFSLLLFI
jgi:hypothetical protein